MAAAAPTCRSLGKNLMLIRKGAGKNDAEAYGETEGSDKVVKNQQIAQDDNRRMRSQHSAKPNGVQDMFVHISHVGPSLT